MVSLGPHSDPAVLRVNTLRDEEAEKFGDTPRVSRLERAWIFPTLASVQQLGLEVLAIEARPVDTDPSVPQRESQVLVGHSPSSQLCFSLLQRKSSKAKEKKQKRLEERAAMDAVCAKVDAANRVTLPSFPVPSSWNFNLFFNFTSFGATLWQNCVTTHPHRCLLAENAPK